MTAPFGNLAAALEAAAHTTRAKNGLERSDTIKAVSSLRPFFKVRAADSGAESRLAMAAVTRARNSGLTKVLSLTTADTVAVETPAAFATSLIEPNQHSANR